MTKVHYKIAKTSFKIKTKTSPFKIVNNIIVNNTKITLWEKHLWTNHSFEWWISWFEMNELNDALTNQTESFDEFIWLNDQQLTEGEDCVNNNLNFSLFIIRRHCISSEDLKYSYGSLLRPYLQRWPMHSPNFLHHIFFMMEQL